MMLVNLEDLWLETQPQNIPGTSEECPNWRNKARYSFEGFKQNGTSSGDATEIGSIPYILVGRIEGELMLSLPELL